MPDYLVHINVASSQGEIKSGTTRPGRCVCHERELNCRPRGRAPLTPEGALAASRPAEAFSCSLYSVLFTILVGQYTCA